MTTTAPAPWRTPKAAAPQPKPQPKAEVPAELLVLDDAEPLDIESVQPAPNDALLPRADTSVILEEFRGKVEALRKTAETLNVTSIEDTAGQKLARETRLQIRQIRLASDKKREGMVEGMTQEVRRINAGFKTIWDEADRLERRLKEQEEFIERETARLEDERRRLRSEEIRLFLTGPLAVDLGKISEEEYQTLLTDTKDLHALKLERERKAEEARLQREEEEAAERERIRQENERLRKEAQEREAAAQRERDAAAAKQRELDAERQRIADEAAAEQRRKDEEARRAAAAPDREKLNVYAAALLALPVPQVSEAAVHVTDKISARIQALAAQIRQAAEGL